MPNRNNQDDVMSPSHYADTGDIECIDAMVSAHGMEATRAYCKLAAFKYIWRCNSKHETDEKDLAKAVWYLRFANGDDPREDK